MLEAPSGPVPIEADVGPDGRCRGVTFQGPPSFVAVRDAVVPLDPAACRALGLTKTEVRVDIAFGGMWYVVVDAPDLDLNLVPAEGARIRAAGELIKKACQRALPVERPPAWKRARPAPPRHRAESTSEARRDRCVPPRHPRFDYPGPDILAFRGPPMGDADARNAVVMSNGYAGMLDRSPCGSGTCAIMALLHARGDLAVGERFVHESVVGSRFVGELREVTAEGAVPAVTGSAWITRYAEVVVDPTDPFPAGFRVGDIW